jgi:pSer/pThr/pTyr-binding forkhead associated (FHA) protein
VTGEAKASQRAFYFPFGFAHRTARTGMPHIRLDDKEIELSVGEMRIGSGDDTQVRLDAGPERGTLAIIIVDPSGTVTVRRVSAGATILVNGVALGAEPAPLLHGDRIEVAGRQLRFSDDRKAGRTVVMPAFNASEPTAVVARRLHVNATGGRLVSLVDGREYGVPTAGLRIGRDAGSDIVVPGNDVSRNHAELSLGPSGYVVRDVSANGVYVNGARTGDAQPLRRGDVIRIGSEEFRFYADAVEEREAEPETRRPVPEAPPAEVVSRVQPTLATLEVVNEGATKGTIYSIRAPLAHIGRGQHNDVIIPDDSVSDSHAKMLRRDSAWFVVDMESTNGTYVAGRRVSGEQPLGTTAAVRFGGVKVIFRSAPEHVDADGGTRVIVGFRPSDQQRAPVARPHVAARQAETGDSTRASRISPLVWIAAAVAIGATVLLVIQDR